MTLGHLALAATAAIVFESLAGFVATGSLLIGMGVLAAPLPSLVVYGLLSDRADWTLHEMRHRSQSADAARLADDLHRSLHPGAKPHEAFAPSDDLFLPDCPALPEAPRADG